jgi:hypothetical protein
MDKVGECAHSKEDRPQKEEREGIAKRGRERSVCYKAKAKGHQVNERHRKGKGEKDVQVYLTPDEGEHHRLTEETEEKKAQKVSRAVAGAVRPLGNQKGEDGEGKAAEITENEDAWKKDDTEMVKEHKGTPKELERIPAEAFFHPAPSFFVSKMLEILPDAPVHTMDLLGGEEKFLYHTVLGVKFHKFTAVKGIEAAEVGAHPVGGERCRRNVEGEGGTVPRTVIGEASGIQGQRALSHGEHWAEWARRWAKEVEHSAENLNYLLDALCTEELLSPDRLIGIL